MDLLSDRPYWPMKNGLPGTYPPLERDVRCEVAVIGAGITGALVAWHLAQAGIKTVVLDRRDVAQGSTAGSTSLLQYEIDVPLHKLQKILGPDRATRAYQGCLQAIHDLGKLVKKLPHNCGFEFKGSLLLASEKAHVPQLRHEYDARAAAGFKVEWWSRQDLARRSSFPQPAAIYSIPRQAAQVDAYALTHALLAAAVKRGAQVYDQTAVVRHQTKGSGVTLVTSRGAKVKAQWIVVASGYEADQFLSKQVTTLHSTYAFASEPIPDFSGWPAGLPVIWETADPYIYLRTTSDRRVIMGGYDEPFQDAKRRDKLLPTKAGALLRRFRQLFPDIPVEIATAWAGTFGKTKDGLPYIGEHPGIPRTWFALGYGGNGITYSLIAAQLFRDHVKGHPNPATDLYSFNRKPAPMK